MKRSFLLAAALLIAAVPAWSTDVGVSVSVGQPGFYGRIDIGRFPAPQVIYPQPVIIAPTPVAVVQQPIYLRVPPGHYNNWGKHCRRYNACGQPVYFVQDDWYQHQYAPRYRGDRDHGHRGGRQDRHQERKGDRYKNHDHRGHDHKGHGKKGRD